MGGIPKGACSRAHANTAWCPAPVAWCAGRPSRPCTLAHCGRSPGTLQRLACERGGACCRIEPFLCLLSGLWQACLLEGAPAQCAGHRSLLLFFVRACFLSCPVYVIVGGAAKKYLCENLLICCKEENRSQSPRTKRQVFVGKRVNTLGHNGPL